VGSGTRHRNLKTEKPAIPQQSKPMQTVWLEQLLWYPCLHPLCVHLASFHDKDSPTLATFYRDRSALFTVTFTTVSSATLADTNLQRQWAGERNLSKTVLAERRRQENSVSVINLITTPPKDSGTIPSNMSDPVVDSPPFLVDPSSNSQDARPMDWFMNW
jgi:hypothetical protein